MITKTKRMILAAKCPPVEGTLENVARSGLEAVELYLSDEALKDVPGIVRTCGNFPLRYAIHAPNNGFRMDALAELYEGISAEIAVFHNVYWEDEWPEIIKRFDGIRARLCMENTYSVHEPVKFMRRYGMGRCLDLEHLQMEAGGIYEDVFISIIREASHIHLTGYVCGSSLWHTHIHHSPEQGIYMLGLLEKAGYSRFVVSEAQVPLQTYSEFRKLKNFYDKWKEKLPAISKTDKGEN